MVGLLLSKIVGMNKISKAIGVQYNVCGSALGLVIPVFPVVGYPTIEIMGGSVRLVLVAVYFRSGIRAPAQAN